MGTHAMSVLRVMVASITLASAGCASSEPVGPKDAEELGDGDHEDAGVDAALPPRCESFAERDGGTMAAGADGGTHGDAGGTDDAGAPAWYESGSCLSRADDCTVHEGRVGHQVCVELGRSYVDYAGRVIYLSSVDGQCAVLEETVLVPDQPSDECIVLRCVDFVCDGVLYDCGFTAYALYALAEPGECLLQVTGHRREQRLYALDFDILFRVRAP
jgi:hypothetical protein